MGLIGAALADVINIACIPILIVGGIIALPVIGIMEIHRKRKDKKLKKAYQKAFHTDLKINKTD